MADFCVNLVPLFNALPQYEKMQNEKLRIIKRGKLNNGGWNIYISKQGKTWSLH